MSIVERAAVSASVMSTSKNTNAFICLLSLPKTNRKIFLLRNAQSSRSKSNNLKNLYKKGGYRNEYSLFRSVCRHRRGYGRCRERRHETSKRTPYARNSDCANLFAGTNQEHSSTGRSNPKDICFLLRCFLPHRRGMGDRQKSPFRPLQSTTSLARKRPMLHCRLTKNEDCHTQQSSFYYATTKPASTKNFRYASAFFSSFIG